MNRYINQNPIPWLLEEDDPEIRYLTIKDIIPEKFKPDEKSAAFAELYGSAGIKSLFQQGNGEILGDQEHFDIYYKGSMWSFAEAVVRGLDRRDRKIEATADYLCRRCQRETGGFTLNWNPEVELSCRTGDMVRYLVQAGYDDNRVRNGIDWIVAHQRNDGGWLHCPLSNAGDLILLLLFRKAGSGLDREGNTDVPSCIYATVSCLMALLFYNDLHDSYGDIINAGAEFFLSKQMLANKQKTVIPVCFERYKNNFLSLGYPVLSQYDILYGLLAVSHANFFNDSRTGEAFNHVISKQNIDGTWNMENFSNGMLYKKERKILRNKSKWVTLNVMRLFKHGGLLES